jgi:hypothetical protein
MPSRPTGKLRIYPRNTPSSADVGWLLEHIGAIFKRSVTDLCDKAVTRPRGRGGLELIVPVGALCNSG